MSDNKEEQEEIKDTYARAEIKVLKHKFDSLYTDLRNHMVYEEKQRDRLEDSINSIKRRLVWLMVSVAGTGGTVASAPSLAKLVGM